MDMHPVADQFDMALLIIAGSSDHSWSPVRKCRHGIVEMCYMAGASLKSLSSRIVVCYSMGDRDHHIVLHLIDKFHCAVIFRSNVYQLDQAARLFLQFFEKDGIALSDMIRRLGTFFLLADESSFLIDADKLGAFSAFVVRSRLHDLMEISF